MAGIFSLSDVRRNKLKDISNKITNNIPEYINYGYFFGGLDSSGSGVYTLDKLDFSTESTSAPGSSVPVPGVGPFSNTAISSQYYGYFGGGISSCRISRLDFSSEVFTTVTSSFTNQKLSSGAVSSNSYGYFGGGYYPPATYANTIERLDFSTETVSSPGKNLSQGRRDLSGVSSSSYGWFCGGSIFPTPTYNTIDRLDFSTETSSLPGKNFPLVKDKSASFSNSSYGYFGGGYGGSPLGNLCTIDRLDFSAETISSPGKNLVRAARNPAGTSSLSYGYFGGGFLPPSVTGSYCNIDRLDFSTEIISAPGKNLSQARNSLSATSERPGIKTFVRNDFENFSESAAYGYFAGGEFGSTGSDSCRIDRLDYSTETTSAPGKLLSDGSRGADGVSTTLYAYIASGKGSPPSTCNIDRLDFSTEATSIISNKVKISGYWRATVWTDSYGYFVGGVSNFCTIDRLDFSTEVVSAPGKRLIRGRRSHFGNQNNLYGYFSGGSDTPGIPPALSTVERMDFSTEIISLPGNNLTTAYGGGGSVSSNFYGYNALNGPTFSVTNRLDFSTETILSPPNKISVYFSNGTSNNYYGYFGGGFSPGGGLPQLSSITRLEFNTETTSILSQRLSQGRATAAAVSGGQSQRVLAGRTEGTYGYLAGTPQSTPVSMDRLDFSTESVTIPTSNLTQARGFLAAVSNNSYGYFGGGYNISAVSTYNTIDRIDFSTETTSAPGKNLTVTRSGLAAVSSSSYGYFGGGGIPATRYNTIDRLDFSNETIIAPGKNLIQARGELVAVSSDSYGYFGGGSVPTPTIFCTIDRIDLSVETTSQPGKNLPRPITNLASVSSASYGYFGGGDVLATPSTLSTIYRLDFITETVSEPGKNLPVAKSSSFGLSSNSYGYIISDSTGGGCLIDRIDFFTETVSAPGKNLSRGRSNGAAVSTEQRASTVNKGFQSFTATYGYIAGGFSPTEIGRCTVYRLDFSNDVNRILPTILTYKSYSLLSVSSSSYGYFGGGYFVGPPTNSTCNIHRLDFSTESIALQGNKISYQVKRGGSLSSNSYGYFVGRNLDSCLITRLDFSNESVSLPGKNLSSDFGGFGGTPTNSYGYLFLDPGFSRHTTIVRLDFSTETTSAPGKNLTQARSDVGIISNNSYGYFSSGIIPTGSPVNVSITERLDFSTENISVSPLKKQLSASIPVSGVNFGYFVGGNVSSNIAKFIFDTETYISSVGSVPSPIYINTSLTNIYKPPIRNGWGWRKTYGYFAGGAGPALPTEVCTIDRLDFSNETVSLPGNSLTFARQGGFGAVSNNLYGYFGHGATSSIFNRLDFNTELVSGGIFGKSPLGNRGSISAVSSTSYGYFVGPSPSPLASTERLDFSTELTSFPSLPTGQLQRSAMCGAFTISYGYFAGGVDPTPATVCSIDRLDFSTEIISSPGTYQLSRKRRSISSAANASYGYFAQGNDPGVSGTVSNFDRLDFSNETTKALTPFVTESYACGETQSGSYAYFGGGFTLFRSTIDRLDFSTETSSTINSKLTQGRDSLDGIQAN